MKLLHVDGSILGDAFRQPRSLGRDRHASEGGGTGSRCHLSRSRRHPDPAPFGRLPGRPPAERDEHPRHPERRRARPDRPRRVPRRRHRGDRRAVVQLHDLVAAQGLDRSHPRGRPDLQVHRERRCRPCSARSGSSSPLRAVVSTEPEHRTRRPSMLRPTCAWSWASSASRTRRSSSPRASRSVRTPVKRPSTLL